jgi:hypothetical protein
MVCLPCCLGEELEEDTDFQGPGIGPGTRRRTIERLYFTLAEVYTGERLAMDTVK